MRKSILLGLFFCNFLLVFSQKPTLKLKAFERYTISGVANTPEVAVGGKEVVEKPKSNNPEYFIYLIANKVPYIKIERVWIKQQLYTASIIKVTQKPVIQQNGISADTLIKYTDEAIWQIVLKGKDKTNIKPKKDIAKLVAANELVLRLIDKNANTYTRSVKAITKLEAVRAM
jgi:hypothetical protein